LEWEKSKHGLKLVRWVYNRCGQQEQNGHARCYWPMLAENHLKRRLFGGMVRRIVALAVATG
jgi:hypothetical protein